MSYAPIIVHNVKYSHRNIIIAFRQTLQTTFVNDDEAAHYGGRIGEFLSKSYINNFGLEVEINRRGNSRERAG